MTVRRRSVKKTRIRPSPSSSANRLCRKPELRVKPARSEDRKQDNFALGVVVVVLSATICDFIASGRDKRRHPGGELTIAVIFSVMLIAGLMFGRRRKRGHRLFAVLSLLLVGGGWLSRYFF